MKLQLFVLSLLILISCGKKDDPEPVPPSDPDWLVDSNLIFNGGPGWDGIPSVDAPEFSIVDSIDFLNNGDLILAIREGDQIKGYPHPILDYHEIVNDEIGETSVALTYCPLTGTGIGWDRVVNGELTTFGVSGLLYNSNLMPYDRASGSIWSQQRLDCVNGELAGSKADLHTFIETTWSTFREAYPEAEVMNLETGYNRNYGEYPYGDYIWNNNAMIFPITTDDSRLPRKERTLGVRINETFKVFPFPDGQAPQMVEETIDGQALTVVASSNLNFIVAFEGAGFNLLDAAEFPFVLGDGNGNRFDIFGFAEDSAVLSLEKPVQFMGYWFSWGTFYEGVDLHEW